MYDTALALRCRQTQIQIIKCRLREIRYTHFTSRVLFGSSALRIHFSSSLKQNVYTTSTQSTEHLLAPNCALQFIETPSLLSKPLVTDKVADCLCFIQRNIALVARSYRHFSSRKSPPSYRSQQAAIIFLALVVTSRRPTVKTHTPAGFLVQILLRRSSLILIESLKTTPNFSSWPQRAIVLAYASTQNDSSTQTTVLR